MAVVNQQFGAFGSTCIRRNPITSFLTSSNLGEGYIVSCPILPIYSPSSACFNLGYLSSQYIYIVVITTYIMETKKCECGHTDQQHYLLEGNCSQCYINGKGCKKFLTPNLDCLKCGQPKQYHKPNRISKGAECNGNGNIN